MGSSLNYESFDVRGVIWGPIGRDFIFSEVATCLLGEP